METAPAEPTDISDELRSEWEGEQDKLKTKLVLENCEPWQSKLEEGLQYVGGVDLSFVKGDDVNACSSLVVTSYPDLKVVYEDCCHIQLTAPYIPGFLAFREVPFLVESFERLKKKNPELMPQVVLVDGNGILHPKEFGLACHLGIILDIPTVGVAKKLFQVDGLEKNAEHADKVKQLAKGGDTFPLIGASGRILGKALRSSDNTENPVYVSIGHKISLETAVCLVHQCCKYRIPEPIRQADIKSREYLRRLFPEQNSQDEKT
ncbi:endonuclease V isoform X1 [Lingula anatina]|uniref:Endonuclease V n=1 Tax=Lingula anatina TaxID=7574 RepID=A0A1S3HFD6_LINAN|nr:endonuclease V isoform X1 [Lingula anatina]|eukprot:XP_013384792.1 endonuclease V isoform X1 [Lingula anatina]